MDRPCQGCGAAPTELGRNLAINWRRLRKARVCRAAPPSAAGLTGRGATTVVPGCGTWPTYATSTRRCRRWKANLTHRTRVEEIRRESSMLSTLDPDLGTWVTRRTASRPFAALGAQRRSRIWCTRGCGVGDRSRARSDRARPCRPARRTGCSAHRGEVWLRLADDSRSGQYHLPERSARAGPARADGFGGVALVVSRWVASARGDGHVSNRRLRSRLRGHGLPFCAATNGRHLHAVSNREACAASLTHAPASRSASAFGVRTLPIGPGALLTVLCGFAIRLCFDGFLISRGRVFTLRIVSERWPGRCRARKYRSSEG
jgi:hypothetical protein